MIQKMSTSVEMLFFGRPEGLEASQSILLKGHLDSLYPEQGIAETTDGHVWRLQFVNLGDTPMQVVSCFKARAVHPAGLEASLEQPSQWPVNLLSEALRASKK